MYGLKQKSFKNPATNAIAGSLLILSMFIWLMVISPDHGGLINTELSENLQIDFINVGEGDAILISTPKGKKFLVDGGADASDKEVASTGRERIHEVLSRNAVKHLNGIIVTHWHNDHLTGLIPVVKNTSIDYIYETPARGKGKGFESFAQACEATKVARQKIHAGMLLNMGDELFVQILHPDESPLSKDYTDQNNASLVLLIRYGRVQVLLTGDIENEGIREIMKYGDGIKSQIIKIPNHGSDSGLYEPFIEAVNAKAGIIMTGEKNGYGHPSLRNISAYEKAGTRVYRTDRQGNIRLLVGGKDENDFRIVVDQKL
ncbi:MAG: ComEC/Rec2 family competence protein [Candidatus Ozemobacteraceae bacterium]|jgi:competence protein ComEC